MSLYLHLNSPRVIKLWYTDPETSQKGEENDGQNVCVFQFLELCLVTQPIPSELQGKGRGTGMRMQTHCVRMIIFTPFEEVGPKRMTEYWYHLLHPGDHTQSCLMPLCGHTGNINLDLVARTPLGIREIKNIGPLGNKGFRACHRNPSNSNWKSKKYMKYPQNMVESRDSYL